ncbi:MAG: DUF4381 domain-containing protein [Gammaproteobacteria bacterium]|nr:DUF4381 domain-containing protein [Gammaproteobacteria bacterium]
MQSDTSNLPIRDIHLPDPVSWWPPALGWWLLLLLIVSSIVLIVRYIRRRQLFKLRNTAMAELDAMYQVYKEQFDARRFVRELSVLLRRICISYFPDSNAGGLIGKQWLVFLDSKLSLKYNKSGQKFSDGVGTVLISAPYQDKLINNDVNVEALYRLSAEWIHSLGPVKRSDTPGEKVNKEAVHVSV